MSEKEDKQLGIKFSIYVSAEKNLNDKRSYNEVVTDNVDACIKITKDYHRSQLAKMPSDEEINYIKSVCEKFINKVETGRTRSRETYADLKKVLNILNESNKD